MSSFSDAAPEEPTQGANEPAPDHDHAELIAALIKLCEIWTGINSMIASMRAEIKGCAQYIPVNT